MSQFTDAEEAFIAAQIPIFDRVIAVHEAEAALEAVSKEADPLFEALDLPNDLDGITRTYELMREAAIRSGRTEDSRVVTDMDESYDMVRQFYVAVPGD